MLGGVPYVLVYFFLQVAASTQKEADAHIPNYPSLPSRLVCLLENVTLHVRFLRFHTLSILDGIRICLFLTVKTFNLILADVHFGVDL